MPTSDYRLEIILPTYQRATILLKNLAALATILRREGHGQVAVRIRDNCSTDGTSELVRDFAAQNQDLSWIIESNEKNIGGEPNCLALLSEAKAEHVMYLGDDDFLPAGYLSFVLEEITQRPETGVIISGFSELLPSGEIVRMRSEAFELKRFEPGCQTMYRLMPLGHQLSGLVFKRIGLAQAYLDLPQHRNLYPFIYFVGNRCRSYPAVYAPKFQVLVSVGAVKDWSYDRSSLLRDVLINYEAVFAGEPVARMRGQLAFMQRNWYRIGGANLLRLPSAFTHVVLWPRLDWLTRLALFARLPWLFVRATALSAYRVMKLLQSRFTASSPVNAR